MSVPHSLAAREPRVIPILFFFYSTRDHLPVCTTLPTPLHFAREKFATFLKDENFPRNHPPMKPPPPPPPANCPATGVSFHAISSCLQQFFESIDLRAPPPPVCVCVCVCMCACALACVRACACVCHQFTPAVDVPPAPLPCPTLSAPPKRSPVGHGSKKMPGTRPAC